MLSNVSVKGVIVAVVTGVGVLYAGYVISGLWTKSSTKHTPSVGSMFTGPRSMNTLDLEAPLPADAKEFLGTKKEVTILEKTLPVETLGHISTVFYREAEGLPDKVPILLLHGQAFTSEEWVKIRTIHFLAHLGHRVVAIDLPGFGNTKEKTRAPATFLSTFIMATSLGKPVVVSPSMSGRFSLPFILAKECSDKVSGFVPVAPVKSDEYPDSTYAACKIPVLVTYGSNDKSLGETSARHLSHFANHKMFVIEGAGHPAYLDKPEIWYRGLYNYLKAFQLT